MARAQHTHYAFQAEGPYGSRKQLRALREQLQTRDKKLLPDDCGLAGAVKTNCGNIGHTAGGRLGFNRPSGVVGVKAPNRKYIAVQSDCDFSYGGCCAQQDRGTPNAVDSNGSKETRFGLPEQESGSSLSIGCESDSISIGDEFRR